MTPAADSAIFCSRLDGYAAASRSVFSLRPSGKMIGSTNCADHGTNQYHACLPKIQPHFRATLAAGGPDKIRLDVGQPDMIGPAVGR